MIRVGLDTNGDGFICAEARPGDALNLFPDALRYATLKRHTEGGANDFINPGRDTPYGNREITVGLAADVASACYLGREGATVDQIPVTAGETYSAGVWVRAQNPENVVPLTLRLLDQTLSTAATAQRTPTATWQRLTVTFTAPVGSTHLCFGLEQAPGSPATIHYATGYMLVAGAVLPEGFNTGDPRDLEDTITPDVLTVAWRLGLAQPYDSVSQPTEGQLTVTNTDGRYAPERDGAYALTPGSMVRVWSDDAVLFTGWLAHVTPEGGDVGARRAVLHLHGPEQALQQVYAQSRLWLNTTARPVIEALLSDAALIHFNRALDAGTVVFPYVGDTWGDGLPVWRILRDLTAAELGRCFTDRHGRIVFYQADHLFNAPIMTTLTDRFDDLHYSYGERLVNCVQVRIRPREVGLPDSPVWRLSSPQRLAAGTCRDITVRCRDDSGRSIAATDIIQPLPAADYIANSLSNGTGSDLTVNVTITAAGEGSTVTLTLCNSGAEEAYLQPGAVLRGTPLIQGDALQVEMRDPASIAAYGQRTLRYSLPYVVDAEQADSLAFYEIARRGLPLGAVKEVSLTSRAPALLAAALPLTLFDSLFIQESHTGHTRDYFIIAETHRIDLAGAQHHLTWTLEPVSPEPAQPE